ncbi:MAG: hypothetical protein ABI609_05695 [Acidobacteriota bacterium]
MSLEVGKRYVNGKELRCPVCEGDQFWTRKTVLHGGRIQLLLELGWAGKRAENQICSRCGHISWFLPPLR